MAKTVRRGLSDYVTQVVRLKGLSAREVAQRSGGKITAGYVIGLMKGTARNPSIEKIKALASGLGVNVHEVFDAGCGIPRSTAAEKAKVDPSHAVMVIDLARKLAVNPQLARIVQEAVRLSPQKQATVMKLVETLQKADKKLKR